MAHKLHLSPGGNIAVSCTKTTVLQGQKWNVYVNTQNLTIDTEIYFLYRAEYKATLNLSILKAPNVHTWTTYELIKALEAPPDTRRCYATLFKRAQYYDPDCNVGSVLAITLFSFHCCQCCPVIPVKSVPRKMNQTSKPHSTVLYKYFLAIWNLERYKSWLSDGPC